MVSLLKSIGSILLLLCIGCIGCFMILYINLNLKSPDNAINVKFRKYAARFTPVRQLLRLHQVGDARYEYMKDVQKPLEVYLYYQEGLSLSQKTLDAISERLYTLTHRYFSLTIHTPVTLRDIPEKITDQDIDFILEKFPTDSDFITTSVPLHIFLLNYYLPHPSYAGLVTDAHTIFLFKKPITYVSDTEDNTYPMEISTILHEFGHLVGAEHSDNTDCIMADTVENLNFYTKVSIRDSYCKEDITAIQHALAF